MVCIGYGNLYYNKGNSRLKPGAMEFYDTVTKVA